MSTVTIDVGADVGIMHSFLNKVKNILAHRIVSVWHSESVDSQELPTNTPKHLLPNESMFFNARHTNMTSDR